MNEATGSGHPEYLQSWSLRRHPFEERIDPEFFYAGSTLMQRLDLLTHLIQFSESIVIVSGPDGSGKSTLLGQFLAHINPQWAVCAIDGSQGEQLAENLAQTIGTPAGEDEKALLARWATQSEPSQQLVIVIDNAELLSESDCARLCELIDLPDGDRLRIVLFGMAQITERVRAKLEQQGSKHTCQTLEIPRLTEEETAAYLMYRLAVAGYSGESPFTPTEIRAICKSADGRPGHINRLANESLVEHHLRARIKQRAPIPNVRKKNNTPLWVGASLVIAVLASYLGWQRLTPDEATMPTAIPPEQPVAEVEQPLELPPETPDDLAINQEPGPVGEQRAADTGADTSEPPQPDTAATTAIPTAAPSTTPPVATTKVTDTTPEPAPAPAPKPLQKTRDTRQPVTPGANTTHLEKTSPVAAAESVPTEQSRNMSPESQTPVKSASAPHREDWLQQQAPGAFTLQLLGSRDPASISEFIRNNNLDPAESAFYKGRYRKADWYVLLYGLYPDKATALAARSSLPDKVQKAKPWPRSLKSVQDSINAAR